jgi:hypothetical protein
MTGNTTGKRADHLLEPVLTNLRSSPARTAELQRSGNSGLSGFSFLPKHEQYRLNPLNPRLPATSKYPQFREPALEFGVLPPFILNRVKT